jgi:hypothetical protein
MGYCSLRMGNRFLHVGNRSLRVENWFLRVGNHSLRMGNPFLRMGRRSLHAFLPVYRDPGPARHDLPAGVRNRLPNPLHKLRPKHDYPNSRRDDRRRQDTPCGYVLRSSNQRVFFRSQMISEELERRIYGFRAPHHPNHHQHGAPLPGIHLQPVRHGDRADRCKQMDLGVGLSPDQPNEALPSVPETAQPSHHPRTSSSGLALVHEDM